MRTAEAVIATTHLDSQGERLSLEALEDLAGRLNSAYLPLWTEHDPRIPPHGRVTNAVVRLREDGEHEVAATLEIFEPGDNTEVGPDAKEMIRRTREYKGLEVSFGIEHRTDEDQEDLASIASLFRTTPTYHAKKASDPISILTIAGTFILGGIAGGFVKEIGSDGWKLLRGKLASLMSRKRGESDRLLVFHLEVEIHGALVDIEVIQTNPGAEDIDHFLADGLAELDRVIPIYLEYQRDVRRLVFESKGKDLTAKFAVRRDCRPLLASELPRQSSAPAGEP